MKSAVTLCVLAIAASAFGGDLWIPIAGTVNNFHTDMRIVNPSASKDIEVQVRFLPVDVTDNNARISGPPVTISVPRRSMRVFDDVVGGVFQSSGLGAIFLTSPDDFKTTSRIYAQVGDSTLGQFCVALGPGQASIRGLLMQLESSTAFRTNIGAVNIANASNVVTWSLYDRNNAKVATVQKSLAAYEVMRPTSITALFPNVTADLSDAWVSFQSSNPLFAYGSVIDNLSTDPTFVPHQQDVFSDD
jgi:hypothetical protein